MKLASYNVESLFERPKAMNLENWNEGKPILTDYAKFNSIIAKKKYGKSDKKIMLELLKKYKLLNSSSSTYFILRENRGNLRKKGKTITQAEIIAKGREDWVGWLELVKAPVKAAAIYNTARAIRDVAADVIGLIEAEDRPGLKHFNEMVLNSDEIRMKAYRHVMLIDGNDERGIDVGIMTSENFPIKSIRSYADELTESRTPLFSRDCAVYEIQTTKGNSLWVLINHLKSKGYGSFAASNARRLEQAKRVKEIYDEIVAAHPYVAVIGDFNDTPNSEALAPICGIDSPLKDVSEGPNFYNDGRPGTYGSCTKSNKIDYILCSPALLAKMEYGGIWRMGVWGGKKGTLFPHYDTMKNIYEAASDHAAIWGEFDI